MTINFAVISIFPSMVLDALQYGIIGRAIDEKLINVIAINPRDFAQDSSVDDKPYGGGPGVVMKLEPLYLAITHAKAIMGDEAAVIVMSPSGTKITQQKLIETQNTISSTGIIFVAGRYEGIDDRLIELVGAQEWCIGDFILSGGEIPVMACIDSLTRLISGSLGNKESMEVESFTDNMLDYPSYTRPRTFMGLEVPEVLLNGNHKQISAWRLQQRATRTRMRRPDIYNKLGEMNE